MGRVGQAVGTLSPLYLTNSATSSGSGQTPEISMGKGNPEIPADMLSRWMSEPETVCKDDFQQIVRISSQKISDIAEKARCYGAAGELERCCEWLNNHYDPSISAGLRHNREEAVLTPKGRALLALEQLGSQGLDPTRIELLRTALNTIPD